MKISTQKANMLSILLGLGLGLCCTCPSFIDVARAFGAVFVRLMQCLAVPIVFFSLLSIMLETQEEGVFRSLFVRTALYTFVTTAIAAALAVVFYVALDPAFGVQCMKGQEILPQGSYIKAAWNLIPSNILDIFVSGNVIGAVFFAFILGCVGRSLPKDLGSGLRNMTKLVSELFLMCARYLVRGLPLFLWAFVVLFIQDFKVDIIMGSIAKYALAVVGTNTVHAFVLLPLLLRFRGFSVLETLRGAWPALSVASLTKSSAVAIPTTLQVCTENLKVKDATARFTVPVCATINMNGCAAFILITTVFMLEVYTGVLPMWGLLAGIFIATLIAIGNAGVPMGCFFLTISLLGAFNVPTNMMSILLPFFLVLDMYETGINVWSDVVITRCIDKDLRKG